MEVWIPSLKLVLSCLLAAAIIPLHANGLDTSSTLQVCNMSGLGPVCGFRDMACGSPYYPRVTQTFTVAGIPGAASVTISLLNTNSSAPNYQLDINFANGYSPVAGDTVR